MLHSFSLHHKQPSLKYKQHLPICSLKSNIPSTLTSIHPLNKPSSSTKNRPNILSQFNYPHKPSLKSTYIPSHPKNHSFSTLNPSKNKSYNNSLHKSFKPKTHLELANTTASTGNKKRISSERVCQLHNKSKKNSSKKNLHQFSFHLIPVVTSNKVNIVNYTNNALKKKNNISFNKYKQLNSQTITNSSINKSNNVSSTKTISYSNSKSQSGVNNNNSNSNNNVNISKPKQLTKMKNKIKLKHKKSHLIPLNPKTKIISPISSTTSSSSLTNKNINNNSTKHFNHLHTNNNTLSFNHIHINTTSTTLNSTTPQDVNEYIDDIYTNLLHEEQNYFTSNTHIKPTYMSTQSNITIEMRNILINWIIEVHFQLQYNNSTLFFCISLIDRYLSYNTIERINYQLLGIAALFISCKQEEVSIPNPKDFLFLTENAYTIEQLYYMEYKILNFTKFYLLIPTALDFVMIHCKRCNLEKKEQYFVMYLITCVLNEYDMLKYSGSLIACCAMYIALKFFGRDKKEYEMFNKSELFNRNGNEYEKEEMLFKHCVLDICLTVDNLSCSEYAATKNKFDNEKFDKVAMMIPNK